jgi:hypothetical protein
MQLNIKKYDCAGIYVLLRDNVIIGMYKTFDDANVAAKQLMQKNIKGSHKKDPYKHKDSDDWIIT